MNSGPYKKNAIQDILMKRNISTKSPINNKILPKSISKEKSNFCLQNKIFTKKFDKNEFLKNIVKTDFKMNPIVSNRVTRSSQSAKAIPKNNDNRVKELENEVESLRQVIIS